MALIACKDCENQISPKAKACPHCGAPTPPEGYGSKEIVAALVFVAITVTLVIASVNSQDEQSRIAHMNHAYQRALCESLSKDGKFNVYNEVYQQGATAKMQEIATKLESGDRVFRGEMIGRCVLNSIK